MLKRLDWISVRRRLARANTPLLLAGVGLVLVGATGAALSVGGVSAKRLPSPASQFVVAIAGVVVILAAFVVGVEAEEEPSTAELADALAEAVLAQWSRAGADRRLEVPAPISVRWRRSALPVAGPV